MRKYVLGAIVFVFPLVIGGCILGFGSRQTGTEYRSSWLAAHPMGLNHQSQSDDLHIPSGPIAALRLLLNDQHLAGNHLQGGAHKPGDVLSDSDLEERPDLSSAAKGSQIYFYVLKEDAIPIGGWTESASVIPCYLKAAEKPAAKPVTTCIHTPLRILAIHKSRATGEASWLALEIPEKLRCTFAEFALAEKRILYQVN